MRSIEQTIVAVLSAAALCVAAGSAMAQDNQRAPGQSSGVQPESSGGAAGGKGTESQSPYTGSPGRTGSAATAKGVPSRDPTASRGKNEEAPVPGRGAPSRGTDRGAGTDSAGSLSGQSPGESAGKGVSEGRRDK